MTPETLAVDHINPLANDHDGHALDNIQLVLRAVNDAKGTMDNIEFISLCRAVADWSLHQRGVS